MTGLGDRRGRVPDLDRRRQRCAVDRRPGVVVTRPPHDPFQGTSDSERMQTEPDMRWWGPELQPPDESGEMGSPRTGL